MAAIVITNGYVSVGGNDLSVYAKKLELTFEGDEVETTAFSSSGWRTYVGGLKVGSVSITFNEDYAAGLLDAILWPLFNTVAAYEFRPVNSAASTSNPKWTGSLLISKMPAIVGSVGDLVEKDVTWPTTSTATRATA